MGDYDAAIREVAAVTARLDARAVNAAPRAAAAVKKAAFDVETTAKVLAPVDTGALRSSIGTDVTTSDTGTEATVGPTVDYAGYVEFGTSRMAPQPYLIPALVKHQREFVDAIDDIGKETLT